MCANRGPQFQYFLLAAWLLHHRAPLLAARDAPALERFFGAPRAPPALRALLRRALRLRAATPAHAEIGPAAFAPLPRGPCYPDFAGAHALPALPALSLSMRLCHARSERFKPSTATNPALSHPRFEDYPLAAAEAAAAERRRLAALRDETARRRGALEALERRTKAAVFEADALTGQVRKGLER